MAVCYFKVSDAALFAVNIHSPSSLTANARYSECEEGKEKMKARGRATTRFVACEYTGRLPMFLYIKQLINVLDVYK